MSLSETDRTRLEVSARMSGPDKARLGQFLTPSVIAQFMAALFTESHTSHCRLLDAGAGIGSLSAAFLERCATGELRFEEVEVDAFEIDLGLHPYLARTLNAYKERVNVDPNVRGGDFIEAAVRELSNDLFADNLPRYTHTILNPPYKKIRSSSTYRTALRRVGIETVNLYSAFVALSLSLLDNHGQLVAIIPRSFCNGPYYKPFREYILERSTIRHLHLFESRKNAFRDDHVLQENIIIMLERGAVQGDVVISTSTASSFKDIVRHTHRIESILVPDDRERFIHIPTSPDCISIEPPLFCSSLHDIGIEVSTGPVVDFRLRDHLRSMPGPGTVPLLYPGHLKGQGTEWPKPGSRKPNAICRNADTEKWFFPMGFYCAVRRFSSKEERRRIMASVVQPSGFIGADLLAFENHLNVFHECKHGLPEALAHGLAVFLNSTVVDEHFRRFNGHTQVNAADLRQMKYPNRRALIALGKWAMGCGELTQELIDDHLNRLAA